MARDILKAKLDIIFKKLFSDKNNEDLLIDLIASLLDIPVNSIEQIEIKNTELLPDDISQKAGRLDLKLRACLHKLTHTSFRQILPNTASSSLDGRQPASRRRQNIVQSVGTDANAQNNIRACGRFPCLRQNYARKSVHASCEDRLLG